MAIEYKKTWLAIALSIVASLWALCSAASAEHGGIDSSILDLLIQEQKIIAASRHEQALTDAPAHATVITKEEIEWFGYESIADILRDQVGFTVFDDLNYHKLGVRAFAPFGDFGSRILLLVDGHPIVEPIMSMAYLERNQPVSIQSIERIEIVRGPGSALYGTNAVLAVINIVTRKPTCSPPASLSACWTQAGGGEVACGLSKVSEKGHSLRLNSTYSDIDGFDYYFEEYDNPPESDGRAIGMDRERTWNIDGLLTKGNFSLRGLLSYRKKRVPTASYECLFGDRRLETFDKVGFIEASLDHEFNNRIRLLSKISFDYFRYNGVWPWDDDQGTVYVFEDPHETRILTAETNLFASSIPRHSIIFGAVLRSILSSRFSAYDISPDYRQYFETEKSKNDLDVFIQDELSLLNQRLSAIGGVRYHHCKLFGDVLSPRFGIILCTGIGKTKMLYGRSFRNPSLYETYYQDVEGECNDGETLANPNLQSETADTYELVHHCRLSAVDATVAVYQYKIKDLIEQLDIGNRCLQYRNGNQVTSRGIEANLSGKLANKTTWSVGWQKATLDFKQSRGEHTHTMAFPDQVGIVKLGFRISKNAKLGLATRYIGKMRTKSDKNLDPIWISDACLTLEDFFKGISLSVSGTNIFNATYLAPASTEHRQDALPQALRHVRIKVSWILKR